MHLYCMVPPWYMYVYIAYIGGGSRGGGTRGTPPRLCMIQYLNFIHFLLLISTLISTTNSGPIDCRSMGSAAVKLIGKWVWS